MLALRSPRAVLWLAAGLVISPLSAFDFADLQKAADDAKPGSTLTVPPGNYQGQLVLRHPITLQAKAATLTHEEGKPGPTLWIQAPDTTVDGLTLVGSGTGTKRDNTALVVTGDRAVLKNLTIREAWAGVWVEGAAGVLIEGLKLQGWKDYPFWERGEGVRLTDTVGSTLRNLDLSFTGDGVLLENARGTDLGTVRVSQARYGVHLMFGSEGRARNLTTKQTVVGLMAMETSDWTIQSSQFTEGYRTGSAGVRQVRTKNLRIEDSRIVRQATGVELLDARAGLLRGNQIEENAIAWSLGGDNGQTRVAANSHRGNLIDLAGGELKEADVVAVDAHSHTASSRGQAPVEASTAKTRPLFQGNYWDAWKGWDLDQDGFGDTPYRFDPETSARITSRPWAGVLLGSPWSSYTQALPGGQSLDPRPLVSPPRFSLSLKDD